MFRTRASIALASLGVLGFLAGCGREPDQTPVSPEAVALQKHLAVHPCPVQPVRLLRPNGHGRPSPGEPVPIPGELIPGFHGCAPGPVEFPGLQGTDVEPSTIGDFQGFSAIGYLYGEAQGSDGKTY